MTPRSIRETCLTLPSMGWLIAFFFIPIIIVASMTFRPADPMGGVGMGWTLDTLRHVWQTPYAPIIVRTIWMTVWSSALCVLLSLPVALHLATVDPRSRRWLLFLVLVPFWTSYLIRIFAWKQLLHPDGIIKDVLVFLHMVEPSDLLMYTPGAVLLITVYTNIPFSLLPIYAAAEKMDYRLLEAARDLGASRWYTFTYVVIPSIYRGLVSAFLLVFIPILGSYVIPDVVGGTNGEMLGNKIAQRVFSDRNLPHACALATGLMLAVLLPLLFAVLLRHRTRDIPKEAAP